VFQAAALQKTPTGSAPLCGLTRATNSRQKHPQHCGGAETGQLGVQRGG